MIKKLLCLWMILALLTGACTAMAEPADTVDRLLTQLDTYLSAAETLFTLRTDVTECVLDFYSQQSYASLISARTVSDQACRQIAVLSAPELSLSDDELLALIAMGVETDAIELGLQSLVSYLSETSHSMDRCKLLLSSSLLQRDQLETLAQWAALDQQITELCIRYECAMLNGILLPLADQERVHEFWKTLSQRYPTIAEKQDEWEADDTVLYARIAQLLDEYGKAISRASEIVGQDSFSVDQFAERLQSGGLDALKAGAVVLEDMPFMAPLPTDWLSLATAHCMPSDEMNGALPEVLTLWDTDVTLEAFNDYIRLLSDYGAELYRQEGSDEAGWSYALVIEDHALMLDWSPSGLAMVGYNPAYLSLESYVYVLCCQ